MLAPTTRRTQGGAKTDVTPLKAKAKAAATEKAGEEEEEASSGSVTLCVSYMACRCKLECVSWRPVSHQRAGGKLAPFVAPIYV